METAATGQVCSVPLIDKLEWMRQRQKAKRGEQAEDRRFNDRLRFDQNNRIWNPPPEPRSLIPSTWPAFEQAVRKWGIPGQGVPRKIWS